MRLKMIFTLKKPELDIEYRRAFLSLLKNSFQETSQEVYKKLYDSTAMKPFTFGIYLPQPKFGKQSVELATNEITLNFSTSESRLGVYFYNALVKKKSRFLDYPLANDNTLRLKSVFLQKESPVNSPEMVFKTLSPILVRVHAKEDNKDEYLTADDPQFTSHLEANIGVMLKELTGSSEPVAFMPVKMNKPVLVRHYGVVIDGNTGLFKLTGRPRVLDFIYKVGLGSRRSEGFGMVSIIG